MRYALYRHCTQPGRETEVFLVAEGTLPDLEAQKQEGDIIEEISGPLSRVVE